MPTSPALFDEFFASGMEESISPFLTDRSRFLSKNLALKSGMAGAIFLALGFGFHFYLTPLSHLFLIFAYFFAGTQALIETIDDLKNFEINIDVLMTLAAFLSVVIGSPMEGALLLVLFSLSGGIEEMVSKKSMGAVAALKGLSPTSALVHEGTDVVPRAVSEVEVGDHFLVRAGDVIPLDGKVFSGQSFVNLVHLTGESVPRSVTVGDEVPAGGQNLDGTLTVEVTRTSNDSTLARMINLMTEAQEAKPKVQRFLDRFSKRYATSIIALAFLFALILPWLTAIPYLGAEGAIYRALAFLIAASPCALILGAPTAYLSALSACARKGILLKGGMTLDALASAKAFAFDKTGTLTTGKLTCVSLSPRTDEALIAAASLEQYANHPIGQAILDFAQKENLPLEEVQNFRAIAGLGLEGIWRGKAVAIGNRAFLMQKKNTLQLPPTSGQYTVCFLLMDSTLVTFELADEIRPGTEGIVRQLKERYGLTSIMLTGDHKESAHTVAKQVGIERIYFDLRPEGKVEQIAALAQEGGVAMVGDGINDAPALARASVGISMGTIGSGAAIEASDIVLLRDELALLGWLVSKAKKTLRIVRENLILALVTIAFATTPTLLGYIPLWLAVLLHEGGTLLVGLNSLRLLRSGEPIQAKCS